MLSRNGTSSLRKTRKRTSIQISFTMLLYLGLWFVLVDSDVTSWLFGLAAAVTATVIHFKIQLSGPGGAALSSRVTAFVRFSLFFLLQSLKGGIDTARLAYRRHPCDEECLLRYQTKLKSEQANFFFVQMISLMPGTLGVQLTNNNVLIHALSSEASNIAVLQRGEDVVAALFTRQ